MPKKKTDPKSFDHIEYQCSACEFAGDTGKELIAHLPTHGFTEAQAKSAMGKMMMHLDMDTHHVTTYEITIDGARVGAKLVSCGRR